MLDVMKRLGLWAFVVAGLALVAWGVITVVSPSASCRGVEMQPGDTCSYYARDDIDTERLQTYEQRIEAAREQGPTVIVVGALAAAFGVFVALRPAPGARAEEAQASSDIGP